VDDNDDNRYILKNVFKLFGMNAGLDILEAFSGAEAVRVVEEKHPDLVLMDVKMETDYAGLDATRAIRANPAVAKTVIWALTSQAMEAYDSEESDRDKCLRAGCDDYITKPFDQAQLLVRIAKLFNLTIPERIKTRLGLS
jgi:CheY-like chemotaxis protein